MTNIEKALALAKLNIYTFPVNPLTKTPYKGSAGHLDATIDAETLAVWFTMDHPEAEVAIHAGMSELIFLDIDVDETKNGFDTLGFLEIPDTFSYTTRSGNGQHHWYELADSSSIPPSNGYRGMKGIDRKSGSSYVVCWTDDVPTSRDQFATPPEWLLDIPEANNAVSGYNGDVDGWLDSIPHGEPTATVKEIIETLPTSDFGHGEVLSITYRLVRLAAEGHTGVDWAIDQVFATWVKPPFDGPEHRKELADAIYGAIRKAGDEDASISKMLPYSEALELVSARLLDKLIAEPTGKRMYFANIKACIAENLDAEVIESLIWSAPSTMQFARDWGLDYLRQSIARFTSEALYESGEGITPPDNSEAGEDVDSRVSILTPEERELIKNEQHFIKRYTAMVKARVPKQNLPYDVMNAWMILSCAFSEHGYIPRKGSGKEGLNAFGMILGDTTSGKSEARKIMLSVLRELFGYDQGFNIGGNASASALGKKLLERDGLVSFFNKDEAHGSLKLWTDPKGWATGLLEALADLYDGKVDPQLRMSDKDNSGKAAVTHFIMHLQGTPDAIIDILTKELFATGFLARFVWAIGNPREVTFESMAEEDAEYDEVTLGFDPVAKQVANELQYARDKIEAQKTRPGPLPIRITKDAAKRLQKAKWQLIETFSKDQNFDILEPSIMRHGVMARKAASLLAMSEGRTTVDMIDILNALEQLEDWVDTLVTVARKVSSSEFQRLCDNVEKFIKSRPEQEARKESVIRHFKAIETRMVYGYIDSLIAQGRVKEFGGEGGSRWLTTKMEEE